MTRLPDSRAKLGRTATDSFLLATSILKHYFGQEWIDTYLSKPSFLLVDESDRNRQDLSALRMIDLAEVNYNLQLVPGFDDCIARMRAGDIEGTFAELGLGRMLFLNSVPFRYNVPQGVKGKDYDVEVIYPEGLVVCADAKCALEKADLKEKAIANKLEKARQQLPPDRPGIIFVKTPPKWMDESEFLSIVVETTKALFQRSQRIVSVKYYVHQIRSKAATSSSSTLTKRCRIRITGSNLRGIGTCFESSIFRPKQTGCVALAAGAVLS